MWWRFLKRFCSEVQMKRIICKYILSFAVMIALFVGAMTLVYMIPDRLIEWHREYSLTVLAIEEEWESLGNIFGFHGEPGMLDNTTDRVMMELTVPGEAGESALETAMLMHGYTRYWHGYQTILRPLLVLYELHQIRTLNVYVFFALLAAVLFLIGKRLGAPAAIAYGLGMGCAGLITIPSSMQFMACFVVMMVVSLIVLLRYPFKKPENLPLLFMITGMVINFLDFLTAPLITLGGPLVLYLCLQMAHGASPRELVRTWFFCSLMWGVGYALCWVSKWGVALLVGSGDIFAQVEANALRWTTDNAWFESRLDVLLLNFNDFFKFQGLRTAVFPLGCGAFLAACCAFFHKKPSATLLCGTACLAAIALYPYVWYYVMIYHSFEHDWFTYRAQLPTFLCLYWGLCAWIDWKRAGEFARLCRAKLRRGGGEPCDRA